MLSAYLGTAGGVVPTPTSSLVTGYDFLTDAANAVKTELAAGTGTTPDSLITAANISPLDSRSWTAAQLKTKLLGSRHDLIFLAGHFSANNALAADFSTSLLTTDLDASSVNLANSIVFSAGCHSGYNIVDGDGVPGVTVPLDWAEAFAQKRATLIAGTGYQYGDTDFVEYSERLYLDFAKQLRVGTGPVPVGQALVDAKQQYLAGTQLVEGLHQKALIEATLFGLPMLSVNMPTGRTTPPTDTSIVGSTSPQLTGTPGFALGLTTADLTLSPPLTAHTITQTNVDTSGSVTATWLSGPAGIATSPLAPTLPLDAENVTVPGQVLRGVGFRSGAFTDSTVVPLTGTPTTEIRGVHSPFSSSSFYPARPWSINYFDALADAGGATRLMLTPAQYRSTSFGSQTSTQRRYSSIGVRLYYSSNTARRSAAARRRSPRRRPIADVSLVPGTNSVDISTHVVGNPAAGIQGTWVTFSDAAVGGATWSSLDLTQDPERLDALDGHAAAGHDRAREPAGDGPGGQRRGPRHARRQQRRLLPCRRRRHGAGPTGDSARARLAADHGRLRNEHHSCRGTDRRAARRWPGRTVTFAVGSQTVVDTTDASGRAQTSLPLVVRPGSYVLRAAYGGSNSDKPSSDESALTVTKQPTTLTLAPSGGTVPIGTPAGIVATLQAGGEPLSERSVAFIVTGPGSDIGTSRSPTSSARAGSTTTRLHRGHTRSPATSAGRSRSPVARRRTPTPRISPRPTVRP